MNKIFPESNDVPKKHEIRVRSLVLLNNDKPVMGVVSVPHVVWGLRYCVLFKNAYQMELAAAHDDAISHLIDDINAFMIAKIQVINKPIVEQKEYQTLSVSADSTWIPGSPFVDLRNYVYSFAS